ncbi:hypothetical protein Pd630_LPD06119 [Rhodococcus opacus PD630]|nr:hypothetical protein Pd630_LPD06119 [Rhodococcus opacus PD630]
MNLLQHSTTSPYSGNGRGRQAQCACRPRRRSDRTSPISAS